MGRLAWIVSAVLLLAVPAAGGGAPPPPEAVARLLALSPSLREALGASVQWGEAAVEAEEGDTFHIEPRHIRGNALADGRVPWALFARAWHTRSGSQRERTCLSGEVELVVVEDATGAIAGAWTCPLFLVSWRGCCSGGRYGIRIDLPPVRHTLVAVRRLPGGAVAAAAPLEGGAGILGF